MMKIERCITNRYSIKTETEPLARLSRYLVSKKTDTRPINRVRYDKVALKVVNILEREDWLAIRGMSESAEYIAAKSALEVYFEFVGQDTKPLAPDELLHGGR